MVFKANSFSPVAVPQIIVEKLSDTEEGSNESPAESNEVPGGTPTGDETNVTEVAVFAALCGLAMLTMIVYQRKRKRA
jgi:hypothetical protein